LAKRSKFSGPDDPRVRRALCIVAHPDDIDFFCAGTVLRLTGRRALVDFVLVTSGDKGSHEPEATSAELAATREREQLAAATVLGAGRVEFLRHPDAEVVESLELRRELVREIRRSRPEVLLTFDPTPGYRQHPDHRAVGRVALDAAWPCARDRLWYPELGAPHETAEAWLFAGTGAGLVVDVRDELEEKIRARLLHRSQTGSPAALRARWRRMAGEEQFVQVDLR